MIKTGTDKLYAFGAEGLRSATRFALGIAVARWAGADAYAIFVLLLTAEVVVHTLANSAWAMPMTTLAPGQDEPQRSALIRHAARRHVCASVLSGPLLLALGPLLAPGAGWAVYLGCALAVAATGVLNFYRNWLGAVFRSRSMFWADLFSNGLPLAAVGVAWFHGDVVLAYWYARGLGALLAVALMARAAPRSPLHGARPDPGALGSFGDMGRHMLVGSLANAACSRSQPFVLAAVATTAGISLFGAANTLIGPARMLSMALSVVLRPRLSLHFRAGNDDAGWRTTLKGLGLASLAGVGLLALFLVAGESIARLVFGPSFAGLERVLPWAGAYALTAAVTGVLAIVIQTMDGAKKTAQLRIAAGAVSLALTFPGCFFFGAPGAFGSLFASELLYAACAGHHLRGLRRARAATPTTPDESSPSPAPSSPESRKRPGQRAA
ncbi:MAG: hypothetical protein AAF682_23215 [Planctomycetota bacterium]